MSLMVRLAKLEEQLSVAEQKATVALANMAMLCERVEALEARRGPGRPRKDAA